MGISFIGFRVKCSLLALGLLLAWAEKPFMSASFYGRGLRLVEVTC
jgi:hypothetical protein